MITTIIFDQAEVQVAGLLGVEHSIAPLVGEKKEEILSKLAGSDLVAFFHGEISEDEYLSRTIRKNEWRIDADKLKQAIRDNFKEVEGTRKVVEELKEEGYKLGLLSVHGREWIDYISNEFNFTTLFHSVSYSYEVGVSKPDKRAYHIILEKLGSKPEECVFIDDSKRNLVPAREMGMHTILFTNAVQLRQDLTTLGIRLGKPHKRKTYY